VRRGRGGNLRRSGRLLEEGDIVAAGERLRAALRVGRRVAIVICDRVAAPILTGIVRPAILLPPPSWQAVCPSRWK